MIACLARDLCLLSIDAVMALSLAWWIYFGRSCVNDATDQGMEIADE